MASPSSSPERGTSLASSESPTPPELPGEELHCQICDEKFKQPRILSCLHVFCTQCLVKQLEGDSLDDGGLGGLEDEVEEDEGEDLMEEINKKESEDEDTAVEEELDSITKAAIAHAEAKKESAGLGLTDLTLKAEKLLNPEPQVINCPVCSQETPLGEQGVESLQVDLVLSNMQEVSGLEETFCTSCKAQDHAVARCNDCANFLCDACVKAHQYMRCFENHKVVSFDEMKNTGGVAVHKPLFCPLHVTETVKYFCSTCQETICNDCMVVQHKQSEHDVSRIADVETQNLEELQAMVRETKRKAETCGETSSKLEGMQQELQLQRDNAKGLIQETFQTLKAVLDKRQEGLLKELGDIHNQKREEIWELSHNVEKMLERIDDGCEFVERVLKNGNSTEVLSMKKVISTQLMSLINNAVKREIGVKITFRADQEGFEKAVKTTMAFEEEEEEKVESEDATLLPHDLSPSLSSAHTSDALAAALEGTGFNMHQLLTPVTTPGTDFGLSGMPHLPPLSIPANLSSVAEVISSISTIPNISSDRSSSRNSYSPAMSDSGISVDAGSTGITPLHPNPFLSTLAKHGTVNIDSQGQITLNGQVIQGLNINALSGLPRGQTPTQQTDAALASLMSIGGSNSSLTDNHRSSTPQLNDIAGLLTQANRQLNDLSSITGTGGGLLGTAGLGINGPLSLQTPPPSTPTPPAFQNSPPFPGPQRKMSPMQIRCKFGQLGPGKGQFNSPHGFCLGMDEDIVVADTNNHRVQVFEKTGEFKYQFGIPGREEGQLWYPRKVAVMRQTGRYVVCDRGNERSRMQIFTKNGHFIRKIAIRYIDIVAGLAITHAGHIVAVDSVSPTVFCIADSGDLVKWFDCSDYMREPSDIAISGKEFFVCDFKGHCVVVFDEDGHFLRRIGCENITNFPNGIDISDAGDVLIGDSHGNRFHVAVFQRDGSMIGEFECPYVKVSRCCGLKITSEGYVVTLAKNNHHVLVLNTLYIA